VWSGCLSVRRPIVSAVVCALGALLVSHPAAGGGRPVVIVQASHGEERAKATFVDPDTLAVTGGVSLETEPWPVRFDPSGSSLFVFGASYVLAKGAVVALAEDGRIVAEDPMGREGVKLGKGLGIGLAALLSVGYIVPSGMPAVPETFGEPAGPAMSLGPDGAYLYALNLFTRDVSLFDTAKHDLVGFVPTGGGTFRMMRAQGDANLWIESRSRLVRLNTSTNVIDRTIPLSEGVTVDTVTFDLRRARAWITMRTKVLVLDLRTGEIAGTLESSSPASAVWIETR
jgi:hypothetical protein